MIPKNITHDHIIQALEQIDRTGVPYHKESVIYDLVYKNKSYPPKHVIRIANKFANGVEWDEHHSGSESNDFLRARGFDIVSKKDEIEALTSALLHRFPTIWRCADSKLWRQISSSNLLTMDWLDAQRDYLQKPIVASEKGKNAIRPWVNELQKGDLVFIMDKNHFYGIAITQGQYDFKGPLLEGKPAIPIRLLYSLPEGGDKHNLETHPQPSTFARIDQYNFGLKKVLSYLKTNQVEGFKVLQNLIENSSNLTMQQASFKNPLFLNTILYGPPGTGKTYSTINKALEILGEDIAGHSREELRELFDKRLKEGRIAFTTFHQSMSYEDFIEGIKPQEPRREGEGIIYRIEDGIFKRLAEKADSRMGNFLEVIEKLKQEISETDNKKPVTIKSPGSTFDVTYRSGSMFYIRPHNSTKEDTWYPVSIENIEKFHNTDSQDGIYNTTYVRGIHQFLVKERGLKKGKVSGTELLPYILIIDEINRGNVSQIFGELITLIEEDKRLGNKESLEIILPYSKKPFGVPPNLYLVGTMNTADRSVEALDTALRRRFSFVEMPPRPELLSPERMYWQLLWDYNHSPWDDPEFIRKEYALFDLLGAGETLRQEDPKYQLWERMEKEGKHENQIAYFNGLFNGPLDLQKLLEIINRRIEKLLDKDHQIGHAYFLGIEAFDHPIHQLRLIFQNKIIPLLQEYFYGNYGKMQLVVGKAFVFKEEDQSKSADTFFADSDYEGKEDAIDREVYHIRNWLTTNLDGSFLYSDKEFISAVVRIYNPKWNG